MGRLILLLILFYAGFIGLRILRRLMGGFQQHVGSRQAKTPPKASWEGQDVEDADFEDIE